MRIGPMITDLSAKRDRRRLATGANNTYRDLKRQAHKRERANNRIHLLDDGDHTTSPAPSASAVGTSPEPIRARWPTASGAQLSAREAESSRGRQE